MSIVGRSGPSAAPASAGPLVQFLNVVKSYDGRTRVVDNLRLDIADGEFLTLLGPSGSGKTTCIMMLAGFERADQGDIVLAGRSVNRTPAYKRNIGVVFQNYALFPHMSVAENVAYPLKQRGLSRGATAGKVARALDMIQLTALGDRYPKQLSGGQQQRVALARALVFEPKLIVMDEPLGALDRRLREHMQIEIKQLHERIGMTVVYVTHDQSEALTMSDRIAVFNRGRIEQIGVPTEVYENPKTSFVAHFVGENNKLLGRVRTLDAQRCLIELDGGHTVAARHVEPFEVGDRVEIAVRPEHMRLATGEPGRNELRVELVDSIYNGDHVLLPCRLQGGAQILLKAPGEQFGAVSVRKGELLSIGWPDHHALAFRAVTDRSESGSGVLGAAGL